MSDAFTKLDEDDLAPPPDIPEWETHGDLSLLVSPKVIGIVITVGDAAIGLARFSDKSVVRFPPSTPKSIFECIERLFQEGRPVWERFDRDPLDEVKAEKPKTSAPKTGYTMEREPPTRRGEQGAFVWNFKGAQSVNCNKEPTDG